MFCLYLMPLACYHRIIEVQKLIAHARFSMPCCCHAMPVQKGTCSQPKKTWKNTHHERNQNTVPQKLLCTWFVWVVFVMVNTNARHVFLFVHVELLFLSPMKLLKLPFSCLPLPPLRMVRCSALGIFQTKFVA